MAEAQSDDVVLLIGGSRFSGWTDVSIEIDLDAGASSFSLEVTKKDPERNEDWQIEAGSAAKVQIGGETVIDGYVDKAGSSLEADTHTISVSGRSKTADLVDCSAVAKPGSWKQRRIEDIASELAKPFGVKVTAKASTGSPLRQFALQPAETVFEAISRLCQQRGLLPVPQADGSLILMAAEVSGGTARIVEGEQPLAVSAEHDVTDRFSQVIAKGQSAGDDDIHGKAASQPKAEASDPSVKRYRPLIIMAEEQADQATLKKRAAWEISVRAARSQAASVTTTGWRREDGALWALMNGVDLDAPSVWISDLLMVAGIKFEQGDRGRLVELRLVRPQAYSPQPIPPEAKTSKIKRKSRRSKKEQRRDEEKAK